MIWNMNRAANCCPNLQNEGERQMENATKTNLFEDMPIPNAIRKLMIPTIISSLVMVVYSLADTYFVGLLNNPVQNAAVTLAAPALLAFNAVNNLFGVGSSSMMSRALGRGEHDTVRKSSAFGFYGALSFGIVLSLLCGVFFHPLLGMLGAEENTLAATADYMRWAVVCGAVPSIVNVVMAYLVRAEGAALHASIGTMSGCLLNLILDPIFILPWGLGMGAAGAGCATFLSNCVACVYFMALLYVKRGKTYVSIHPKDFKLQKEIVLGVFGVGIPASIQNLLNVTGMTILNNFAASYGADAVAAIGIAQKINMVPLQIALGGTQGSMPLISYSYASKNYKRMKEAIGYIAKLLLPTMSVVAACYWFGAGGLIGLFMKNPEIIRYGTMFLHAMSLSLPFLVADFLVVGVFQGFGMGKKALVFAILRKIVFEIPAIVVLNLVFGVNGLAYGAFVAEFMLSIIGITTLGKTIKDL